LRKKRAVFFYDSFYPAYKAGGPVQSLTNLCNTLAADLDIYVLCSAYENDGLPLQNIELNKWNHALGVQVYYMTRQQLNGKFIKNILTAIEPDIFFINGVFSVKLSILPLFLWHRFFSKRAKLILSPRGMLQQGALKIKPAKKKLFLVAFKMLRLHRGIRWHATDVQEANDIKHLFGNNAEVSITPNIPKIPYSAVAVINKKSNELKLVFLSVITEKKNLLPAIQYLKELDLPVSFDIYGPIKENEYWEKCAKEIASLPAHIVVAYKGDVEPAKVQQTFAAYHALLLPTKGENFGHAIYECLSVGRPVVISNKTPWSGLQQKRAGFDVEVQDAKTFKDSIELLYHMDGAAYQEWCSGALAQATAFYQQHNFRSEYLQLFQ